MRDRDGWEGEAGGTLAKSRESGKAEPEGVRPRWGLSKGVIRGLAVEDEGVRPPLGD